ncbi:MAG TPA: Fic family protein [Lichenihabitans sp.]|nr:Fic family protein [Lichenihabitans sp.]
MASLDKWYDVELTYTSNAIEGGTLTRSETAIVIEKGITIGGKPLVDHIEAVDHHHALEVAREIARQGRPVTEADVLRLHELVLHRSKPGVAGCYAQAPRRIAGSGVIFPSPMKIPILMADFGQTLETREGWIGAAEAHFGLVSIHPFADGNGRIARLMMNLLLLRDGYPPISIGPEQRADYLAVLERRQLAEPLGHGVTDRPAHEAYLDFMGVRLIASLGDHLAFLGQAQD